MDTKKSLALRAKLKKKKPTFVVKESHFTSGVKKRWRFPRGMHSAVRQRHKGRPALPGPGYGSPKSVRGLHSSGLVPVVVRTLKELDIIGVHQGVIVGRCLGNKKRLALISKAQEKKLTILNVANVDSLAKSITQKFEERKKARAARVSKKSRIKEEKKKRVEEKEAKEKSETESKKEGSVEDKIKKEEAQKAIAEKTITKRQ